ncbi:hypothetical protein [Clostridium sp.]|uniref:hypothetical protein n=1 Tax=Clostridium sp. TaxID=1506 RepID=UPI00290DCD3B|nr:hypothetical protein [Clostridium sp.]MDU6542891.1 hypothetical protein [Clostridium sp.]
MKRLVLKKLVIISQKSEEAKVVEFDDKLTVITGENPEGVTINRTGKSVLMKSIYYSLGAKLKKYTSNWNSLQLSTIVSFNYDDKQYELYRSKDRFILKYGDEVNFFESISQLREYFVELFNFKIRMPIKKDDTNTVYAYPGAIFMPFYIDQDKGWSGSWDSFSDIFNGQWKQEVLLYHMGIRTAKYYELLEEKVDLELNNKENKRQENTLKIVLKNHIEKYKGYLDINLDLNTFAEEISQLTNELNIQMNKRNIIKEEIVNCFNELREWEELFVAAEKVYNELLKDVDYVENDLQEDTVICPICGTMHENSIQNHFNMYSEIQECEETMQSYFEERSKIEKRVQKQMDELKGLEDYINKINEILDRKREAVTFKDIVVAEGSKSILEDLRLELSQTQTSIERIQKRLNDITTEQRTITRAGKHINDLYLEKLKINLEMLNVTDIDSKDLKRFKASFNSGGNDLPCAILAQIFTLYLISSRYSTTVSAPIVLDAIFQQEPAKEKINAIWDFVITNQPQDSQVIISTTEMHDKEVEGKVIKLTKEKGLLNREDYISENKNIIFYKNELLNRLKIEIKN